MTTPPGRRTSIPPGVLPPSCRQEKAYPVSCRQAVASRLFPIVKGGVVNHHEDRVVESSFLVQKEVRNLVSARPGEPGYEVQYRALAQVHFQGPAADVCNGGQANEF